MKTIVYSTKDCSRCKILKDWLQRMDMEFEERDLENTNVMTELVMMNISTYEAPLLQINDKVYYKEEFFDEDCLNIMKLYYLVKK